MSYLTCEGLSPIFDVVATAQGLIFAQQDGALTRVAGPLKGLPELPDGVIITSQRDELFRLTLEPSSRERLHWRGERVFASAHVEDHLVLVGSTGVIADLDDRVHDYRCLDGSKPRRLSRREARSR